MDISGFSSSAPRNQVGPSAFNELTSGQFLQIIFTELTNQDPFQPNDSQAMLQQLATIRSIEADTQMTNKLTALVRQNELAAAAGLIGSLVSGISLDNRRVADLVISVSQTAEGPVLNLFDGSRMFFSQVDEIVGPLNPPGPTDPTNPPGPTDPVDPAPPGPGGNAHRPVGPGDVTPVGPSNPSGPKQEKLVGPAGAPGR